METRASQLKFYSLGIVAINKPLTSKNIEVICIEDHPFADGEIDSVVNKDNTKGSDRDGEQYSIDLNSTITVKATWLPLCNSNRLTAPDVRRGEMVAVWKFADTDQYWWTTLKDDMKLRKLETVIYAFSGTQKESDDITADNSYWIEISTHHKMIHLHTSKENGELCTYDVQINTADGFIVIKDDVGNSITLNTPEHQILAINSDNSRVDINKKGITLQSDDFILLKSKDIKTDSQTLENIASESHSIETNKQTMKMSTQDIDSSSSIKLKTANITITAAKGSIV